MDTPSITNIKTRRVEIKEALKRVRAHDFGQSRFGAESEFTDRSVIAGIEAVLVDVDALCGAPARFIKNSTGQERKTLSALFDQLLNHCNNLDLSNAVNVIEQIKPILRSLGIRGSDERRVAFENHIDELQRKSVALSSEIEGLRSTKSELEAELEKVQSALEAAESKISHIDSVGSGIDAALSSAEATVQKVNDIYETCTEKLEETEASRSAAEAARNQVEDFSKRVAQREIQLDNQEQRTKDYAISLNAFHEERVKLLADAKALIDSARTALGYKTAEGLSAAFIEKSREAKEDKSTWAWIGAAAVFVAAAIGVGIWVTLDSGTAIELVVGRVSLIPILLGGAWFSAAQYIKQRNIAEEYAYKSVLVRSMVGFSEQISGADGKGEDHSHYIRDVLEEIHANPLRRPQEKNKSIDRMIGLLKELKGPLEKLADKAGQ